MTLAKLVPAVAAIALLGACEARFGNDAAPVEANATAENRSADGRLTIEAPGFNLQMDLPENMRDRANFDGDNSLIYPDATFRGIHVQGGREQGAKGGVELRFTTADPIDRVAGWYRDPARASEFAIVSDTPDGGGFAIAGTEREDNDRFTVHIVPREGGGTDGRLLLTETN